MGIGYNWQRGRVGRLQRARQPFERSNVRHIHHHQRNVHGQNHQRRHHGEHQRNIALATTDIDISSNQSGQTVTSSPCDKLVQFGVFVSFLGTFLTYLSVINVVFIIPGSIVLGVGALMMIIATIFDLKRNFPGHNVNILNVRIRFHCKLLSYVWLLIGSVLACTGFVQYSQHPLAIAGCSIIGLAVVVLLVGLISAQCLELDEMTNGTLQRTYTTTAGDINSSTIPHVSVNIESNPEPIPSISANISRSPSDTASSVLSKRSELSCTQIFSDLQILGTVLSIPGVCFSCIGWVRNSDHIVVGTLGVILLPIGGMLILMSAFMIVCSASKASEKRSALSKIKIWSFISGIPLTAVGFIYSHPSLALGIAGACILGLSLISFIALRCCYKQGQTATNDPAALGPHLGGYLYAGSEMPNTAYPGTYSYSSGNQIYPDQGATGINTAYPPTNYGPSTTAQSADNDLPSYNQAKDMPMPNFQASDIGALIASSNTDQVDDANIPPFQHVNEEDLPPPPSYDEVVKSGSNDSI